jgi:hypothetical protein
MIDLDDVLVLVGAILVAVGLWLLSPILVLVWAGLLLMGLGLARLRRKETRR